ncbi:MAG: GNAT family N-acetyltransferase [Croceibacterium sp.]
MELVLKNWRVERLSSGDGAKLEKIAPEVFVDPIDPPLLKEYLAEPLMQMVLARQGELVIGQARCAIHRHPEKPADGYVDDVRVTPAFQRRGVARAMLTELESWAREKGCVDLWLATDAGNIGTRALYERFASSKPCVLYYWDL